MSENATPRQAFGAMLTHFRTRAGMSPEVLGPRVYLSGSMIRKIESGDRGPTDELVTALEQVPELGSGGALRALFDSLEPHFRNGKAFPGWFAPWPEKEARAVRLRSFSLVVLDGLLQTEDYARAILATRVGATPEEIDEAVRGRLRRQEILDQEDSPELWALIDEGILRRPVGSPEVMRTLMKRLADMARRPNIVIQVVPLEAGAHEGLRGGPFVVAEFADATVAGYQDSAVTGEVVEDENAVTGLARLWDSIRLEALPRAASLRLIEEAEQLWT